MQFTTASYSQHLFSVRFLPLEKMAIAYNSTHSYFFTWSCHPKPCMCLHFSTQITHHTHTQDERKGDLPKKASHTDTCFPFPMGHLGVKYTKSACGNVHSLKISAYQALSIQEGENSPFKVEKTGRHHHNPVTEVKIMNDNTNQHRAPPDRLHCEHGPSLVFLLNLVSRLESLQNNWPALFKVLAHVRKNGNRRKQDRVYKGDLSKLKTKCDPGTGKKQLAKFE